MRRKLLSLALTAALLPGCASDPTPPATLAKLPEPQLPSGKQEIKAPDLAHVEARYRGALEVATDPVVRQHILVRLADLEMARSERAQQQARTLTDFYTQPISHYRELIKAYEADPAHSVASQPDALYYKLAKAYALDGRTREAAATLDSLATRFPHSPYIAETQFRRAERAFANGHYARAEHLYRQVAASPSASFADNALYMQGWAAYKQSHYKTAVAIFTQLLDQQFSGVSKPGDVAGALTAMHPNQRNLVDDTLRVISYSYANLNGPQTIAKQQQNIGARPYQHLLYDSLAKLYLKQQRYLDSADAYARFVNHNANADIAPDFSIREIHVYQEGGFPSLVLPAKRAYINRYGLHSHYWQARTDIAAPVNALQARQLGHSQQPHNMSPEALDKLRQYLQELARHNHAQAQALAKRRARGGKNAPQQADVNRAFNEAADLYQQFIETFPTDSAAGEMTFLMAEALNQGGRTIDALGAYEAVAFTQKNPQYGADAGYSAVLLAQQLVKRTKRDETPHGAENKAQTSPASMADAPVNSSLWQWQQRKIANSLKFAQLYPQDPRAVNVLAETAPELMYQGDLTGAARVARQVIQWQPRAQGALRYSAWLTLGHAQFAQQHYREAEAAYWQALKLNKRYGGKPGAPTTAELRERIAASIYQRAQGQLAAGKRTAAIEQLTRITRELGDTRVAPQALFDAGHAAQMGKQWTLAEKLLQQFARRYPHNALNARLPAKFIVIYQATGAWGKAADVLSQQAHSSQNAKLARQSLLSAAQYYQKAGNWQAARDHFREYAHQYPKPVDDLLEVQQRLVALYQQHHSTAKRNYWLKAIMATAARAPTERSRYLAAQAATTLAQAPYQRFAKLALTLPIKQSLAKKRTALKAALAAQKRVLDFKVAQFTTRANYYIGEIYVQLSQDLLHSQRPKGLKPLELEQYNILLEEQAYPFEEKAIDLHEANAQRSWQGGYDKWIARSIKSLGKILPARYGKTETTVEAARDIY